MIYLTTGLPGAGKTLYTITTVNKRAEEEKRPVFYSGIAGVSLGWEELADPREWFKVPEGAIVVIDECQTVLPAAGKSRGGEVPEFVQAFSTHRHRGLDVYLITQDPMQFDHFVRRLVGVHYHCVRPYGMSYATVWQFEGVQKPDDYFAQQKATKSRFDYPKEAFSFYKSAEVHTHKRRLPWKRLFWVFVAFAILGAGGFFAWRTVSAMSKPDEPEKPAPASIEGKIKDAVGFGAKAGSSSSSPAPPPVPGVVTPREFKAEESKVEAQAYLMARVPRYNDIPESAPVYDELTKVVSFPRLAGCIVGRSGCKCFTQQATPVSGVSDALCRHFVAVGAFDHYRADYTPPAPEAASTDRAQPLQGAGAQGDGVAARPALPQLAGVPKTPTQMSDKTHFEKGPPMAVAATRSTGPPPRRPPPPPPADGRPW